MASESLSAVIYAAWGRARLGMGIYDHGSARGASGEARTLEWIKGVWASSTPIEFESAYGLEESVTRFKAATKRSVVSVLATKECAAGTVKSTRVSLSILATLHPDGWQLVQTDLRGHFEQHDPQTALAGQFRVLDGDDQNSGRT